ncbi:MAG: DUF4276 family protein [Lachnospiraceae bacterium]|nr:DUF4276 family protein [Lachnospiraceae bacterium]
MKRLIVYCEGLTEQSFVKTVLAPYFLTMDISVVPKGAGGVSKYSKIKKELIRICKGDRMALITTMIDYYGLPRDTPGYTTASGTIYEKAQHIEKTVEKDLGLNNLLFNLSVHEYEGLLFSSISTFEGIADDKQIDALKTIIQKFETPEHINNSYDTAPSKRIEKIIPSYSKITDGTKIALKIGIDGISLKCKHFEQWISKLTAWAKDCTYE